MVITLMLFGFWGLSFYMDWVFFSSRENARMEVIIDKYNKENFN